MTSFATVLHDLISLFSNCCQMIPFNTTYYLSLGVTSLHGTIPKYIYNLTELNYLNLGSSQIAGEVLARGVNFLAQSARKLET